MTNHSPSGPIDQCQIGSAEIKIIDFGFGLDNTHFPNEEEILIFTKNEVICGWFVRKDFPKTCKDLLEDNNGKVRNLGWPISQKVIDGKISYFGREHV